MRTTCFALVAMLAGCATVPSYNLDGKRELSAGDYVMVRLQETDRYRCKNPKLELSCNAYGGKMECTCTTD